MKLTVLGSGSSGNCYLIHNEDECLIIEAGVKFVEVKRALDFDISAIVGVLVSHSHLDHSKYISEYQKAGIRVYSSQETFDSLGITSPFIRIIEHGIKYNIDRFIVKPFIVEHDVFCFGFLIHHPDTGLICFVTDTYYIKYKFPGLSHIMVEANFSEEILDERAINDDLDITVRNRVNTSHMSIETVETMLLANDLSKVRNIVLLHLSDGNSDEKGFVDRIQNTTGKKTIAADKGITINLNKEPF